MNSKAKGNKFERMISKKLSLYLTNNKKDDTIWRSISSGAFATNKQKKGIKSLHNVGDLSSTSDESKLFIDIFNIECKSYKSVDLMKLFDEKCIILDWYKKLYKDCEFNSELNYTKLPFIIFKQNHKHIIGVTSLIAFDHLFSQQIENNYKNYIQYVFEVKPNKFEDIVLFKFDDLINYKYNEQNLLNLKNSLIKVNYIKNLLKNDKDITQYETQS